MRSHGMFRRHSKRNHGVPAVHRVSRMMHKNGVGGPHCMVGPEELRHQGQNCMRMHVPCMREGNAYPMQPCMFQQACHHMGHDAMKRRHRKMNRKHCRRTSSSSSSSSSSDSSDGEDSTVADGICSLQIESGLQEKPQNGHGDAGASAEHGDYCKWKIKSKKNKKLLKLIEKYKKGKGEWSTIDKLVKVDSQDPKWRVSVQSHGHCKGGKRGQPSGADEGTADIASPRDLRRARQTRQGGDDVDLFFSSVAEQVKKMKDAQLIGKAKVKILEAVNELVQASPSEPEAPETPAE